MKRLVKILLLAMLVVVCICTSIIGLMSMKWSNDRICNELPVFEDNSDGGMEKRQVVFEDHGSFNVLIRDERLFMVHPKNGVMAWCRHNKGSSEKWSDGMVSA